jgi:hypothetical protein
MGTRVLGLAVTAALSFTAAAVAAQSQDGTATTHQAAATASVPRTPWGHPDLQGTWDYRTITPLERPRQFGDREFLTDQEVKEMEARAAKRMDEPPADDAPASTVHPSYWTDPGRRVAESRRTSLIIDPPDGRLPALTAAGQARVAAAPRAPGGRPGGRADSWLDRTPLERCITYGMPNNILPGLYNNNIQIVQAPGYVAIVHEMVHDTRVIPLDGRPALTGTIPQWLGSSRGYWDGDTLVVETKDFTNKTNYRGAGAQLHLTERYRRVDVDTIDYRITVDDPTTWTRPWTATYVMRPSEGDLIEYACHEGNYGLRNMLEVARDEEKAAAEAAKK